MKGFKTALVELFCKAERSGTVFEAICVPAIIWSCPNTGFVINQHETCFHKPKIKNPED
jgi:hypothetical protein